MAGRGSLKTGCFEKFAIKNGFSLVNPSYQGHEFSFITLFALFLKLLMSLRFDASSKARNLSNLVNVHSSKDHHFFF